MKLGIIISVVIVLVVGTVLFFAFSAGPPEKPTRATTDPGKLDAVVLRSGLPMMWEVTAPDANANDLYKKAFDFYRQNRTEFVTGSGMLRKDFDEATADRLTDLLIEASKAGKVTTPFLDDQIPMTPRAEPSFKDSLELVPTIVEARAKQHYEAGNVARATAGAMACWALGNRVLEKSNRFYPREKAPFIMVIAGTNIREWNPESTTMEDQLNAWGDELIRMKTLLDERKNIIAVLRPHQGDLINMARNDKDLGTRIEAILSIGVLKFNPKTKGNAAAFEDILAEAQADENPLIAEAAKGAATLTKEEMRKLR